MIPALSPLLFCSLHIDVIVIQHIFWPYFIPHFAKSIDIIFFDCHNKNLYWVTPSHWKNAILFDIIDKSSPEYQIFSIIYPLFFVKIRLSPVFSESSFFHVNPVDYLYRIVYLLICSIIKLWYKKTGSFTCSEYHISSYCKKTARRIRYDQQSALENSCYLQIL